LPCRWEISPSHLSPSDLNPTAGIRRLYRIGIAQ
jgi:hypothetical protein